MKTITITSVTVPQATGTLTSNNTNVTNNKVVVIGSKTYTFKTALTPTEGEVLIGANADATLLNLIRAINHTGTPGTHYKCAVANTQVTAATSVTAHAFAVTSIEWGLDGNSIVTTTDETTLSWGAATLTGGNTISFSGTVADATYLQPAQRVSVPDYPAANSNWSRAIRATTEVMRIDRVGASSVGMILSSFGKLGYSVEPSLSWPATITDPTAQSCVHSSTSATFTVAVVANEFTTTYQWQESSNGGTDYFDITDGGIYAGATTASLVLTPTATTQNGYKYRCTILNGGSRSYSAGATLTVT